jgi:dihydroorotase
MPNTVPTVDGPEILEGVLARMRNEAVIPTGQMGAVTRGLKGSELTEMDMMTSVGAAGFTDDGMPIADSGIFRKALRYQQLTGLPIALHEEDRSLSLGASINEGSVSARLGLVGGTGLSESVMIARDLLIAANEGAAIHLQHLSDARSVEAVRLAKQHGVTVTAEASPHHLLLTEEACGSLDSRSKMNPPLRFEHDRLALIDGLVDGTIDCVATDHAPHSDDEKQQPFEDSPFGVTGLETSFAALYDELVLSGIMSLSTLVERMTSGCVPFGFDAPLIAAGAPANLALFDPTSEWVAGEGGWASRSSNSCFVGRRFSGRIVITVACGVVVHRSQGGNTQ